MKRFLIALVALTVVHSAVSLAAYGLLTKKTVETLTDPKAVDTSTPDQRARGESTYTMTMIQKWKTSVPTPVAFYVWFGYSGLAAAVVYRLWFAVRHGV